jgi:hypothetical protein
MDVVVRSLLIPVVLLLVGCRFDTSGVAAGDSAHGSDTWTETSTDQAWWDSGHDAPFDAGAEGTTLDLGPLDLASDALMPVPDKSVPVPDKSVPDQLVPDMKVCLTWLPKPTTFDPCTIPAPGAALSITTGTWVYNSGSNTLTAPGGGTSSPASQLIAQPSGPQLRVVSTTQLAVAKGAELRLVGANPVAIASWSTITIHGTVNASSVRNAGSVVTGAGANPAACATSAPTSGGVVSGDGAGGGGGGFGGDGGEGGSADGGSGSGGSAGGAVSVPTVLRGGCAGADGAGTSPVGEGGAGGGAVLLGARTSITVAGVIHAGGAAGGGATGYEAGAGGGGSGGMVMFEAPSVTVAAGGVLAANGGAGGEGAMNHTDGHDGQNGLASATAASGGTGTSGGGDGGDGGCKASTTGDDGLEGDDGGGGGGGGVGFVVIRAQSYSSSGTISPDPDTI